MDIQYVSHRAPSSETSIPLESSDGKQLLHGPRVTLATANGLALGDPLARARRLYGRAFVETVAPNAQRDGTLVQRLGAGGFLALVSAAGVAVAGMLEGAVRIPKIRPAPRA